MSDFGLYSGLYDQLREYGDLLDEVLVSLKADQSHPQDEKRQRLAGVMVALASGQTTDLSLKILAMVLRQHLHRDPQIWPQIADALQKPAFSAELVIRLEELARAVEHERAGTLAQMRGWSR